MQVNSNQSNNFRMIKGMRKNSISRLRKKIRNKKTKKKNNFLPSKIYKIFFAVLHNFKWAYIVRSFRKNSNFFIIFIQAIYKWTTEIPLRHQLAVLRLIFQITGFKGSNQRTMLHKNLHKGIYISWNINTQYISQPFQVVTNIKASTSRLQNTPPPYSQW